MPFASLGLDTRLLEGIRDLGFKETRPIQTAVIPLALARQRPDRLRRNRHRQDRAFVVPTLQWLLTVGRPASDGPADPIRRDAR